MLREATEFMMHFHTRHSSSTSNLANMTPFGQLPTPVPQNHLSAKAKRANLSLEPPGRDGADLLVRRVAFLLVVDGAAAGDLDATVGPGL